MKKKKKAADTGPKYPQVKVKLSGSAFDIMGSVQTEMRRHGIGKGERDAFFAEATASIYDNVLQTAMKWVDIS